MTLWLLGAQEGHFQEINRMSCRLSSFFHLFVKEQTTTITTTTTTAANTTTTTTGKTHALKLPLPFLIQDVFFYEHNSLAMMWD